MRRGTLLPVAKTEEQLLHDVAGAWLVRAMRKRDRGLAGPVARVLEAVSLAVRRGEVTALAKLDALADDYLDTRKADERIAYNTPIRSQSKMFAALKSEAQRALDATKKHDKTKPHFEAKRAVVLAQRMGHAVHTIVNRDVATRAQLQELARWARDADTIDAITLASKALRIIGGFSRQEVDRLRAAGRMKRMRARRNK
jgi:hypothetical protein